MKIGQKIKIISILLLCVLLDIFLHILTSSFGTMPDNPDLGFAATIMGIGTTASLWALLAFSVATFVYWRIRDRILGEGVGKGLRYGAAVALLWFLAMLEGVPLFGNPIIKEIIVGLSDAIPVLLLGVLLGLVTPKTNSGNYTEALCPHQKCKVILLFTVFFSTGKYLAYSTGMIKSGIHGMPIETLVWTILMGIAIGASFVLLENNLNGTSLKHKVWRFSFFIFGMNWAVFLIFMPLMFSGYLADVLFRIVLDTIFVMIASCLAICLNENFLRIGSEKSYTC